MNLLKKISRHLKQVNLDEVQVVRAITCTSFTDLMNIYREDMDVTQSFEDCMALCIAAHVGTCIEGEPIWLYLVGPPSSGKSTICELINADAYHSFSLSNFTGLTTGHIKGQSLIPKMQGKCVIVKDGTLLLEGSPQNLAGIFGELRDIYDGDLRTHYRNGVAEDHTNIKFNMLIGMTEAIYQLNMSALGERFLHCRLEVSRGMELDRNKGVMQRIFSGTRQAASEASSDSDGDVRKFPRQQGATAGFLQYLHNRMREKDSFTSTHSEEDMVLIQDIANVIATARAKSLKLRGRGEEDTLIDGNIESTTRLVSQFCYTALALQEVFGVSSLTPEVRRLLIKLAKDSSTGEQAKILRLLSQQSGPVNRTLIKEHLGFQSIDPVKTKLAGMQSLKLVTTTGGGKGHSIKVEVPPWIRDSYRRIYGDAETTQEGSQSGADKTSRAPKRPPKKKARKAAASGKKKEEQ